MASPIFLKKDRYESRDSFPAEGAEEAQHFLKLIYYIFFTFRFVFRRYAVLLSTYYRFRIDIVYP
ncbi:hypothetical protein HMPREF1141_2731 [Clostridium sp. MSTE9]|nr:hypothetical protein HMPREF1141_2731 [Clostridium sp. MSTE9]